ncbi:MAG: hypothetical protein IJM28_06430 [Lachnospiraceae bacterium]|nr:hypothetical protein [Lachnospiraceae bacterium]
MNLKSYFRGIGAGMIVTAIIMGVSMPKVVSADPVEKETLIETVDKKEIDDKKEIAEATPSVSGDEAFMEEVKKAVSNNEALRNEEKESSDTKEEVKEETQSEESKEEVKKEEKEPEEEILPKPINPMPEGEEGYTDLGELVEIKVIPGDSSVSVARRIYEAGLVESAIELDEFLCQNGYDKSISVGTYEIAKGSDFDTIGKIITRRN